VLYDRMRQWDVMNSPSAGAGTALARCDARSNPLHRHERHTMVNASGETHLASAFAPERDGTNTVSPFVALDARK
jgi:hypothetical protein